MMKEKKEQAAMALCDMIVAHKEAGGQIDENVACAASAAAQLAQIAAGEDKKETAANGESAAAGRSCGFCSNPAVTIESGEGVPICQECLDATVCDNMAFLESLTPEERSRITAP